MPRWILLTALAGCGPKSVPPVAPAATPDGAAPATPPATSNPSATETRFRGRLLGPVLGLGVPCVMLDEPPIGAWTEIVEVLDPGTSSLTIGHKLCVVVHSPTLYERSHWPSGREQDCRYAEGLSPDRWACGGEELVTSLPILTKDLLER